MLQENVLITKEVKLESSLKHKSFLIILKYIPHFTALFYMIYTLLQFAEIDLIFLGYLVHTSIVSWAFMLLTSIVFRYCYVHRLPLYYIALNEMTIIIDTYIGIPTSNIGLLGIHLILIGLLIFGYSYFYVKNHKRNIKLVDK